MYDALGQLKQPRNRRNRETDGSNTGGETKKKKRNRQAAGKDADRDAKIIETVATLRGGGRRRT